MFLLIIYKSCNVNRILHTAKIMLFNFFPVIYNSSIVDC
jgi:hypothetical protein